MSGKLRGIQWLEEQTGQDLSSPPAASVDRHFSVRLPATLLDQLNMMAEDRRTSVFDLVRQIVTTAVDLDADLRAQSDDDLVAQRLMLHHEMQSRRSDAT